ncbi:MAG: tetratricopeptide repeat protein, partial [Anaerolineales bacterium]|nr:tetratricopeptide repeat protein [Anaerolineales bacterium]
AIVLNNLGDVANLQGRHAEAEAHLQESIRLKQALGNEQGLAFSLVHLGQAYLGLRQPEKARGCFLETLRLTQKLTLPPLALAAILGVAELQAANGRAADARQLLRLPLHHPAAWQRTRREARALLERLGEEETAASDAPLPTLEAITAQLLAAGQAKEG